MPRLSSRDVMRRAWFALTDPVVRSVGSRFFRLERALQRHQEFITGNVLDRVLQKMLQEEKDHFAWKLEHCLKECGLDIWKDVPDKTLGQIYPAIVTHSVDFAHHTISHLGQKTQWRGIDKKGQALLVYALVHELYHVKYPYLRKNIEEVLWGVLSADPVKELYDDGRVELLEQIYESCSLKLFQRVIDLPHFKFPAKRFAQRQHEQIQSSKQKRDFMVTRFMPEFEAS